MSCKARKMRLKGLALDRVLIYGMSGLLAFSSCAAISSPIIQKTFSGSIQDKPDPELLLIAVYKDLAANNLRDAQTKADALVAAYPNFQLGHLIRGDLLLMHARPVTALGATVPPASADKLKDLRDEAIARLKSYTSRPNPNLVPRSVLQLRPDQKHVLVVDAKRSRMYVYENLGENLKLVTDYYITQGKLGINKLKEGDQKTPLGVYYITGRVAKNKLPDFYGAGALPINYPNEWDRVNGRTGSGIWLHGTTSKSYSRPPLASDGCVVLTNPDLEKLYPLVEVGNTPVVISDQVDFIDKAQWDATRNTASKLLEAWRQDVEKVNTNHLISQYSNRFKSDLGENLSIWSAKQQKSLAGSSIIPINLNDVSFFVYPGNEDMIVGTFTQNTQLGKTPSSMRKRIYWAKEGTQWKIVHEINLKESPVHVAKQNNKIVPTTELHDTHTKETPIALIKQKIRQPIHAAPETSKEEVLKAVNNWVKAWESQDVKSYLNAYSSNFATPNGESRKEWESERRARIEGKGRIKIKIDAEQVAVNGVTATVKFHQTYVSSQLSAQVKKTLILAKQGNRWLIKEERAG